MTSTSTLALLVGEALHGIDQIGHQVGTPLVLVLHLGPGCLHLLVVGGNIVDTAAGERYGQPRQHESTPKVHSGFSNLRSGTQSSNSPGGLATETPVTA